MKRILQSTKWRVALSRCLMFSILAMLSFTLSQGHGTKAYASSPSATTSSHHPGFEYHLLSQSTTTFAVGPETNAIPNVQPPLSCLNVYMSLANPQTGVLRVYVQVQNLCGETVSNLILTWDTGVTCNGNRFIGPNGSYSLGSLGASKGWNRTSNWSAVCDGEFYPYFPVSYEVGGYDDANGSAPDFLATGSYDTQTYTFI